MDNDPAAFAAVVQGDFFACERFSVGHGKMEVEEPS